MQSAAEQEAASVAGDGGELIAIFVIIAKCAGAERIPEAVMAQLDFGAEPNVPREQAEHGRMGRILQSRDKFADAWTLMAVHLVQQMLQPEHIGIEETLKIPARRGDAVCAEAFAHEGSIGAPGEIQRLGGARDLEFAGECSLESPNPRATGADESAIDIEQNEPNHAAKVEGPWLLGNFAARPGCD